jgi:hypothetical protein
MMEKKEEQTASSSAKIVSGLKAADPAMWHRIIMCVLIGFTGLAVIGGVVVDFIMERQVQQFRAMPVVSIDENTVLPAGQYYIYQVYFDAVNHQHYLVSSVSGGAVVSVAAPEGTGEPADVMEMVHYDPAAYLIDVDQNGAWTFQTTTVYHHLQKKIRGTAEP